MDWITFIKWNGIIYVTYYGANLLLDYLRTSGELKPNSSNTEYQLKDLGIEDPKIIRSSDFLHVNEEKDGVKGGVQDQPKQEEPNNQVEFQAPIKRQGIPLSEFIRIAGKSGNEIFQPTI